MNALVNENETIRRQLFADVLFYQNKKRPIGLYHHLVLSSIKGASGKTLICLSPSYEEKLKTIHSVGVNDWSRLILSLTKWTV